LAALKVRLPSAIIILGALFINGALPAAETNSAVGMVLDLGESSPYIKVTPEYTREAVDAVLPYFSDVARKLRLPIATPITDADILRGHALPFRDIAVSIMLKSGWAFSFQAGIVQQIADSHSFSSLQDPGQLGNYFGKVKMSQDEAVAMARDELKELGFPLTMIYAEQAPIVTQPKHIGTNTIPVYEIEWLDPRKGRCVDIHINAEKRQIERFVVLGKAVRLFEPTLKNEPETAPFWPSVNPEYARQLIPIMFQAIGEYARKLALPIPMPLTTNNIARIQITDNEGWPHAEVTLANGWRFIYRHTMVNGYYSPDVFFSNKPGIDLNDVKGKWNLSETATVQLVKTTLAKLSYPTNNIHTDFRPYLIYAQGEFRKMVPRLFIQWNYTPQGHDDLESKVEAEVNAENGVVESLYYDDTAYWNSRPPISVPISTAKSYPDYEKQFQQN
jgi:hypothetical protein